VLRNSRLLLHLSSLTQTAWMLPAAPGWIGRKFGSARLRWMVALLWPRILCHSALRWVDYTTVTRCWVPHPPTDHDVNPISVVCLSDERQFKKWVVLFFSL